MAAVKATTEPKLRRGVFVVGGDKRWPVTPAGLGRGAGVEQAVDQALAGREPPGTGTSGTGSPTSR